MGLNSGVLVEVHMVRNRSISDHSSIAQAATRYPLPAVVRTPPYDSSRPSLKAR
jgi:hypothetical protein